MAKTRRRKRQQRKRTAAPPPQRRWPWPVAFILLLLGVGALLWFPGRQSGTIPPGTIIAAEHSAPAPPFTLPSTAGERVKLAEYLGEQPVVLVFYMGDF